MSNFLRYGLAVLIPLSAGATQWLLWEYFDPLFWFLFYPAVFVCATLTGFGGGALATVISVLIVWYGFMPPRFSFAVIKTADYFPIIGFAVTGLLFSLFSQRRQALTRVRARADAARENEANYRSFIENAPVALAMLDTDMRYLAVSHVWQHNYAPNGQAILGRTHYELFPDLPEARKAIYRRGLSGEVIRSDEDRVRWLDGTTRWLRWEIRPWRTAGNAVGGLIIFAEDITDRRATEATLQESEQRFRGAFETAPHGMALVSLHGRWLKVNAALCTMLGYSQEELLTTDFQTITHPDDLQTDLGFVRELLDNKRDEYQMEKRYFHKDGKTVWVILSVSLVRTPDNVPIHFVSQIQNIGPLKAAETTLRLVVDSVSNGILLVNRDGTIAMASAVAERIFGYPADTLLGQPVEVLVPEGVRVAHRTHRATYIEAPAIRSMARDKELFGRRRDGSSFPLEVGLSPIEGPEGFQTVVSLVDISQRKAMEQTQSLLAAIVGSSGDAIIGASVDLRITHWNPAAERLFGYTAAEAIGQSVTLLIPPEENVPEIALFDRVRQGASVPAFEAVRLRAVRLRKDGTKIDLSLVLSPIKDPSGTVIGISKIARDISDRKSFEAELRQAKEAAEDANRAKSEFLANMSHEIRTPMNAILGLGHLLARTTLMPDQRDYVEKIVSSGRLLLVNINDILDFSKIEANRLDIERIDFRIVPVFDDLATIMSVNSAARDLELAIALDPAIPRRLRGDPSRLQQILVNLAGNAIKFTESGSVTVRADLVERGSGHVTIGFSVRDTGIGMTVEQQGRLFQPFSQADGTTTRRFGGTGLGLAISKRLTELMGGSIGVESQVGQSSEFWFTLPFEEPQMQAEDGEDGEDGLDDLLIFTVDDSDIARNTIAETVRGLGWQEEAVASGAEALHRLRDRVHGGRRFDALLIDWQMPGMDGLETSRRIREECLEGTAPVIVMVTAFNREEVLRGPDAAVADAVLVKPITPSALYNAVAEARARRPGRRKPAASAPGNEESSRLPGIRILVVEDNAINQDVARKILEQEGAVVTVVADGRQAVDWVAENRPAIDLVLMDAQMPVMDGFEATARIRTVPNARDLPIIAVSAGVRSSDREKCLAAGMTDFVAKPLDVETLIQVIHRHAPPRPPAPAVAVAAPPVHGHASPHVPAGSPLTLIPGLDPRQAMLRLGGDEAMLRSLLLRLAESADGLVDALRADIETGALPQAARRMHTLRGSAGNLGVVGLASTADALEVAILAGRRSEWPRMAADLDAAVTAFRRGVASALDTADAETEASPPPPPEEIAQLVALLQEGNLAALDVYQALGPSLKAALPPGRRKALADALDRLDFKAAMGAIDAEGNQPP